MFEALTELLTFVSDLFDSDAADAAGLHDLLDGGDGDGTIGPGGNIGTGNP